MISWLRFATKKLSRTTTAPPASSPEAAPAPRKLFFSGDSHCLAYGGIQATVGAGVPVRCESRLCSSAEGFLASNCAVRENGRFRLSPVLAALLPAEPVWLAVSVGGADGIVLSMDEMWKEYDFFDPETPGHVDKSRRPLPLAVVKEWIADRFNPVREMLQLLRQDGRYQLNVIAPPPPYASDEACQAHLRDRGIEAFIAPFHVRAKITRMCYLAVKEACRREGVEFIDTWRFAVDGLALKSQYEFDGFHCNRSYAHEALDLAFGAPGRSRQPRLTEA